MFQHDLLEGFCDIPDILSSPTIEKTEVDKTK